MPVDYSQFQTGVDPLQMAMKGFADAGAIQQAQQQRAVGQQNYDLNQMKIAEYQKAQEKKQEFQTAVAQLNEKANPTAQDYQQIIVNFPELGKVYESSLETLNDEQRQATTTQATTIYSLLQGGNTALAKAKIEQYAAAAENGGNASMAEAMRVLSEQIDMDPNAARDTAGLLLASTQGEKFGATLKAINTARNENALQPMLKAKATSEAATAAMNARFAESLAAAEAGSKGLDISSLIVDPAIAKENKRLANLTQMRDAATSDLARQQLEGKIADAQIARDDATLAKVNEIETAQLNVDTMKLTIDDLKTLGDKELSFGPFSFQSVRDAATGTLEGSEYAPTWNQDVADYQEALATLRSQVFLTQIPKMKGLGALTGPEGAKLETALKSLALRQSSERLKDNISTIEALTLKAQDYLRGKYGDISTNAAAAKLRAEGGAGVIVPGSTQGFRLINKRPGTP